MPLVDDIAAIRADGNRTEDEKRVAVYDLKNEAIRDIIVNGKPAPQPIPPLINREFTLDGTTIRVNACSIVVKNGTPTLFIDVTLTRDAVTVTHQVFYTNPPVIPRSPSGNEKQDLIAAASEMIAQLPVA
jgi:hypothetical protein